MLLFTACPNKAKEFALSMYDALVRLGQELGVEVTAEGIETPEELAVVRASGCSDGQGFLLGQPVARPEFGGAPAWTNVAPRKS